LLLIIQKTGTMDEKVLDVKHKDAITKHAFSRSQGAYWSVIFINKDMSKIRFWFYWTSYKH